MSGNATWIAALNHFSTPSELSDCTMSSENRSRSLIVEHFNQQVGQ